MQYMYNNYISQFINNNIKSLQGSVGAHCWSLKSSAGLVCVPQPSDVSALGVWGGRKQGAVVSKQAGPQVFKVEGSGSPARETSALVFLRQRLVTETGVLVWRRGVQRTTRHRFYGHHTSQRKSQDHTPHTHHPAKKIKDQNVVSSEINSPVSLVWGGSALLVYVRFSWVFLPPPGLLTYSIV